MTDEEAEFNEEDMSPDDVDWEKRILCRDESCIGVIGPDGRCKECGKLYEAPHPENHVDVEASAETDDDLDEVDQLEVDNDWESRTLCSDESCIGVIGPDGHCKECGKPYKG
jgi:hypothetical protein